MRGSMRRAPDSRRAVEAMEGLHGLARPHLISKLPKELLSLFITPIEPKIECSQASSLAFGPSLPVTRPHDPCHPGGIA